MADMSERTNKHTSLTAFAERVMGRWSQTPISATVQRAIRLTNSTVSTPLTRATATEGFIQRVTQPKTTVAVWKPSATTKQTAIEGFTDALIQRFPDISAKYVARMEESAPAGQPELIHSGSTSVSTGTEVAGSDKDSAGTVTSEAFDVNKLPSIPAEVLARHKAGLQRRAEASGTPPATAPAPRTVQRKSVPANPQLVRPRSKVEYFGSKGEPAPSVAPIAAGDPTPSAPEPTSAAPIQAKAEEPTIQETTPLEEPKWRTRPRAGFQSIPTRGTEGEASPTIPYQPIQAQRSTPAESSEGSVESEITVPPSSNTGTTAIQRVVDSTLIQADGGDDNDLTPPPDTTPPPDGPPPPSAPSSLPPDTTLQRVAAPETESPEMPLRAKPQAMPPIERITESAGESVLPSLTGAVPAKAVRRTSQTPPILRKPIVPSAAHPQGMSVSDTSVTPPVTRSVTASSTVPSPSIDKGTGAVTPVQRQVSTTTPIQRVVASQSDGEVGQESVYKSLYEMQEVPSSVNTSPSPVSSAPLSMDAPVQREVESDAAERIVAEPNLPSSVLPDRDAMPLRSVESPSVPTVQRQVAEENSAPVSIIEAKNLPDEASFTPATSPSVNATPSVPHADFSTATPVSSDMPSSAIPSAPAPVQRKAEAIQPTESSLASVPATNANADTPKVEVSSVDTPPVQRMTADLRQPEATVPERDEMPLRAVEPSHTETPVFPVQRQEATAKAATSPVKEIASSASPSTESRGTGILVQRVVSDSQTPVAPPASMVSEAQQQPESSPTLASDVTPSAVGVPETKISAPAVPATPVVPTDTAPVQRVAAEPATLEIPNRADMTLRVEDTPAPVQRKSEDTFTASVGLDSSTSGSMTPSESIAPVDSPANPTVATTTALPTEVHSVTSTIEASPSQSEKSAIPPTKPIQRVVADITPPPSTVPTQADMPLRHEEAIPYTVVQRQVEKDEPVSPDTLSAPSEALQPHSEDAPQRDTGTGAAQQASQSIAPPIQRMVDLSSPAEPVERISAEISPTSPTLPSSVDMPLRREESQGVLPVQRQVATETGQANSPSGEKPQPPLQRVTNEGIQTQPLENAPLVEKGDNASPSQSPVQRKATDANQVQVLSEAFLHTDIPPSQPALQRVGDDSETLEPPTQRVSAEIAPTGSTLPTQADMPLRTENAINSPALQRVTDESRATLPEGGATPPGERGEEKPFSRSPLQRVGDDSAKPQIPIQRAIAESTLASTSPLSTQADTPNREGINTASIQPVSGAGSPPFAASEVTSPGKRGEDSETRRIPVQRVSAEIAPPPPALPTQADMPLRVETGDRKETASVQRVEDNSSETQDSINTMPLSERGDASPSLSTMQRVANENIIAHPINDSPSEVRGEAPASQSPVQRTANQGNQVQSSSDTVPFEKHTETPPVQPLQRMEGESSPAQLSSFERVSGEITPTAPTLPAQTDMPLRVNTSDVPNPPLLQRLSDNGINSVTDMGEIEGTINGPAIQREAVSPSTEALPVQRVIAEVTPATPILPVNADMPLRHLESSGTPHAEEQGTTPVSPNTSDTSPVQRVSVEAVPHRESQEPQVRDASSKIESSVSQQSVTDTSTTQRTTLPAKPVSETATLSLNDPTVQRVVASIETTSPELPTQADMPLRETTAPPLQRQAIPLENNASTAEPSDPPTVAPLSQGENRTSGNTQAVPILPTEQTARPLQRIVSHGGASTETQNTAIQRKPAVKAAQIRRSNTPSVGQSAMPVAPMQRRASTTVRFDNPTLASIPLPTASTRIESTGVEAESEAGLPLQRISLDQPLALPLQRVTPSLSPAMSSTSDLPVRVLRRAPIAEISNPDSPVQRVVVPTTDMPLVQRAERTETVVEPEEQQEVNIDLSDYFNDNNNAPGNGNNEPAKAMGGAEKKAPTESDALKALQTLADEIYPLIKQMVARERERHRGF